MDERLTAAVFSGHVLADLILEILRVRAPAPGHAIAA